jgi:hypothetical protein
MNSSRRRFVDLVVMPLASLAPFDSPRKRR